MVKRRESGKVGQRRERKNEKLEQRYRESKRKREMGKVGERRNEKIGEIERSEKLGERYR